MLFLKEGDSLEIARKLIHKTGLDESLAIFEGKNQSKEISPNDMLNWVLALSTCNLLQTMKVDFVGRELDPDDLQDIVDDYVVESLRRQNLLKLRDGAELMEKCEGILSSVGELEAHWASGEDPKGPGPRYYCVKDVLKRLGNTLNYDLHDALFEFMYLQHKYYIDFFRELLKPPTIPGI